MAQPMRVALTGDSLVTRRVSIYDDDPTRQLFDALRSTDVRFTNLETLTNNFRGYPAQEPGGTHLAADDWALDDLVDCGFNLFAVPNNHNFDYSIEGLLALIEILNDRGLCYAGVGLNLAEARRPAYFQSPRGTVGMVACSASFGQGQQASEQRPDMIGRPGLNPLRHHTTHVVRPEQLAMLKTIAEELGIEQRRLDGIKFGFSFPPDDPDVTPFMGHNFVAGDMPEIRTKANTSDLDALCGWIEEAGRNSDLVIASFHAHDQGKSKEDPAEFHIEFAHAAVDAGADIVVGHGPHLLRAIEIYKNRPIFYSLGNFIDQNELVYKQPSDAYERFRIDPALRPAEFFAARSKNDSVGFPADRRYWETVMPVCEWNGSDLSSITLYPVSLGLGEPLHQRGRPRMAHGDEAERILASLAKLSGEYGTQMTICDEVGSVKL